MSEEDITLSDNSPDVAFENLLNYIKGSRGFDFTDYKRASLMRRIDKQMQTAGVKTYAEYVDYLEVHPEEFERLFNTILINVTAFFRDAPAWEYLSGEIIPRLIAAKTQDEPIRIWSAGCASGQEPYSLAIALAEKLGFEKFRERVKIYATDVDEHALSEARLASYTPREVQGLPPELLEKYFERESGHFSFRKDLRRAVIFGRHDLLQDAPISRIDLLLCRNTVMYFNSQVQARILARFHFAVNDGGCLFLGKAEMLFSHTSLFLPLDLKRRIFVKVPKDNLRDRLKMMVQAGPDAMDMFADNPLRDAVFTTSPVAQIVVGVNGLLAMVNERAHALFHLNARDVGRPFQDMELSYRPVELRSCIEQAYTDRRPVSINDIPWPLPGGKMLFLEALLVPIQDAGALLGVSISFTDVTRARQLSEELQETGRELETAYEELQSTNEELETTNEELQSTVEELETTNEELQSTNEELETTNEELHSTNEELQTINDEFRQRSDELNHANSFLQSILSSLRGGVIVLDRDLRVQIWNSKSEDLWGLRSEEIQGKSFLSLDMGLPVDKLIGAVRGCLKERNIDEVSITACNRRGKSIQGKVFIKPLFGREEEISGVILLMEEQVETDTYERRQLH